MWSNSFKESQHSFTFENLDENIAEMVVDETSPVCVNTLIVHARSDDIKRCHGDRNKHRCAHGGSYWHHEGARGKPLFLDDDLLDLGERRELDRRTDGDPDHGGC